MPGTADAKAVTHRYVDAWTSADSDEIRAVLAADAAVEWNLDLPADPARLVGVLHHIAGAARTVTVTAETYSGADAALVYDCAARFGSVRTAEFLRVARGQVVQVRQVYDLTAVRRYLPDLLG